MFYYIASYSKQYISCLNIIHYVSFRAIASLLTALLLSLIVGEWFIEWSKKFFRSTAREWTPDSHKLKNNIPTMGGLWILSVFFITTFLWNNLTDHRIWIFCFCVFFFGAIGCWDDWNKIQYKRGISAQTKFAMQVFIALTTLCLMLFFNIIDTTISFPFFKWLNPNVGVVFFILWGLFIIVGTSNSVNLTDGLDGLAISSLLPNFTTFAVICYLAGHMVFSAYLQIPFAGSAELSIIGASLIGTSLGFLWYNAYPAQIFMGDVGSLALGAALSLMALMSKQELLLPITGGLFMIETVTVILQVMSFRIYGKRLFKMAPIHHHFELLGWQESKITTRFGIISLVCCLLGLILLKIR
jgi:phospho-N-acetylmuramoyl-pentapeptide-transferase